MKRLFLTFILFFSLAYAYANTIVIQGEIIDKKSGIPLSGVNVFNSNNKAQKTISGLNGSFTLKVESLPIELTINYVGYKTQKYIVSKQNNNTIAIEAIVEDLKEVQVNSSLEKNNDILARNIEKNAASISNIVSAKAIELSPDFNVANVIQRISGVTLERTSNGDAQYATLRGMDKRYNYTLVNGIKIPSPDNKNRFLPLDIFPSDMLARLEVTKSLTADMEGDGIGGAINMVMKDAPSVKSFSINTSTGYNSLFLDRQFLSFNKDAINLQSPFESYSNLYAAKPRDFANGLTKITSNKPAPNLFFNSSFGNRILRKKLGYMVGVSYQNSYRGGDITNYGSSISTSDASNLPVVTGKSDRTFSDQQTRLGVHGKLDYIISEKNKIQWYNAYLDFKNYQIRDTRGIDYSIGYDPSKGNYNVSYSTRFRYTHQNIYNSTVIGDHLFMNSKLKFDWTLAYSKAYNEIPENTTVNTVSTVRNNIENQISVVTLGGQSVRWEHNTDEDISGKFNFISTVNLNKGALEIATGGLYRDKQRANFFNEYDLRPFDDSKPLGQKNNLIKGVDWKDYSEIKYTVYNPYGSTGDPLNYNASEVITAGYVQTKLLKENYQLNTGVRVENTNQGYNLLNPVAGVKNIGEQVYTDVLPSIHLKYLLNENKNLRVSYSRSINRPSFFEIVPYKIINEEFTEMGNPDLKHTVADNFDIRYEIFPKPAEQFLIGIFYKNINNPIETGIVDQGQGSFFTPTNFGVAKNYGLEIDLTKYFFNFGVKFNYTYTNSSITTTKVYYELNTDPNSSVKNVLKTGTQTRQLNGQAANLANLTLIYKSIKNSIDFQLSAVYTGDKLFAVSRFLNNDTWQSSFVQLDASLEKKVKKSTLFIKANNILNTPISLYLKKYNKVNETISGYENFNNGTLLRKDLNGINIQVGFKFKI
jgi:TonB-dependent receptor